MEKWKQTFYGCKQWKQVSNVVLILSKGICCDCNKLVKGKHSVHHTITLTKYNYTDPMISLNVELLVLLCETCHNKRHNKLYVESFLNSRTNAINYDKRDEKLNPPLKKSRF